MWDWPDKRLNSKMIGPRMLKKRKWEIWQGGGHREGHKTWIWLGSDLEAAKKRPYSSEGSMLKKSRGRGKDMHSKRTSLRKAQ